MISNFDDDGINFVRFIQENKDLFKKTKDIFYELLESGRYNLTSSNKKYICDGYYFSKILIYWMMLTFMDWLMT